MPIVEHEICRSTTLLENLYETIYYASSTDLYEEVRISGMLFWEQLVRSSTSKSEKIEEEFFERLACTGCLEVSSHSQICFDYYKFLKGT